MSYIIPFNRPCFEGNEQIYMAQAVENGHISGDGPYTHQCHRLLEREWGIPKALLTTSCTHALELAAILLDIHLYNDLPANDLEFVVKSIHEFEDSKA